MINGLVAVSVDVTAMGEISAEDGSTSVVFPIAVLNSSVEDLSVHPKDVKEDSVRE